MRAAGCEAGICLIGLHAPHIDITEGADKVAAVSDIPPCIARGKSQPGQQRSSRLRACLPANRHERLG
eukprot:SAG25_NODE_8476_length_420_cov_0.641745_1_plen_68_part_00